MKSYSLFLLGLFGIIMGTFLAIDCYPRCPIGCISAIAFVLACSLIIVDNLG